MYHLMIASDKYTQLSILLIFVMQIKLYKKSHHRSWEVLVIIQIS